MHDARTDQSPASARTSSSGTALSGILGSRLEFTIGNDPALFVPVISSVGRHLMAYAGCEAGPRHKIELALHEALANALFHGNLEVDSELRREASSAYFDLAEQRRHERPYSHRAIEVKVSIEGAEVEVEVRDQGPGFDTSRLERLTAPSPDMLSGRGLLLIRSCMDEVAFNHRGNCVRMLKRLK